MSHDNQDTNEGGNRGTGSRARSEPPSSLPSKEEVNKIKLIVPPSFVRSSSLSSDSSCPTPSSVQSDVNVSWEDVQQSEKEDPSKVRRRNEIQRTSSEGRNKQCSEDKRLWGRVCTGSYSRAMEKFNKNNNEPNKKSIVQLNGLQQNEKTRRKSSPAMPQYINP